MMPGLPSGRRPNTRMREMIEAARSTCAMMRSSLLAMKPRRASSSSNGGGSSPGSGGPGRASIRAFCAAIRMTFSGWLSSCAMPVVISPSVTSLDVSVSAFCA